MFSPITTSKSGGIVVKSADYKEYLCDTEADIALLSAEINNISVGSKAIVLDTKNVYILSNNKTWVFLCKYDGGSASFDVATKSDVINYLDL